MKVEQLLTSSGISQEFLQPSWRALARRMSILEEIYSFCDQGVMDNSTIAITLI
jgi:hypothetical protein